MNCAAKLVDIYGSQAEVARAFQLDRAVVHNWVKTGYVPARWAGEVERITGGQISAVEIVNETAHTMDLLQHRPCPSEDPEDWNEIPIGPDGVAPGDTARTFLPQPGCFDLSAEGEGCFGEGTTGTMQIGDVVAWTITEDDLVCVGR